MKNIVNNLETYRLEKRISQVKLASMLGVAFCTVNRWFNKRNRPGKIQEYQIAKLLKGRIKYERSKKAGNRTN